MFAEKNEIDSYSSGIIGVAESAQSVEIASFDNYAEICNYNNDSSRRRGILSTEEYREVVEDPTTFFVSTGELRLPVMVDVKHGLSMGYDIEKSTDYAKSISPNVKILAMPFHELNQDEKNQLLELIKNEKGFALHFSDHNDDESRALAEFLTNSGISYYEKPLIDSRAAAGDEQAAVCMYTCGVEQKSERGPKRKVSLREVKDYYDSYIGAQYSDEGDIVQRLTMGDEINEELAENLWELLNDKFNDLGENHPLYVQDTKKDFYELIRSNKVILSAAYNVHPDGSEKVVCFTYFIEGIGSLIWLNENFLNKEYSDFYGENDYTTNLFTPGLVSSAKGRSHSFSVIGLFSRAADESGINATVIYESTNLSKGYVPKIVYTAMQRACKNSVVRPAEISDNTIYRLWSINVEVE